MKRKQNESDEVGEKQFDLVLDGDQIRSRPRSKKKRSFGGNPYHNLSLAGELGFDIALPMLVGIILGDKLDEYWGTAPKAALFLFLAGCVVACTSLIRIVRGASKGR